MSNSEQKIKVFPYKNIVSIQISGAFYARIQNAFMSKCETLDKEHIEAIVLKLKEGKRAESTLEEEVMIFLALMSAIEKAAVDQNKVEDQDVPTED